MPEVIVTKIGRIKDPVERFFAYARERHDIYLRRAAGQPRPWTDDEVLQRYRFTNVYRELDKTTAWFRDHVREPLRDKPEVLLATVLFRMLNRIEVGEAAFCQTQMDVEPLGYETAFWQYVATGDIRHVRRAIVNFVGKRGPYVTGAYIISTPPGRGKLDGVLWIVDNFRKTSDWHDVARHWSKRDPSLEEVFDWLSGFDYLGKFHSYEIVTDLRHTSLLSRAPDILTWANMGPGAQRGLNRLAGRRKRDADGRDAWGARVPTEQALDEMQQILRASRDADYWPQSGKATAKSAKNAADYPRWELREVEHTLCEFDKYERTRSGEGRPRGVFN